MLPLDLTLLLLLIHNIPEKFLLSTEITKGILFSKLFYLIVTLFITCKISWLHHAQGTQVGILYLLTEQHTSLVSFFSSLWTKVFLQPILHLVRLTCVGWPCILVYPDQSWSIPVNQASLLIEPSHSQSDPVWMINQSHLFMLLWKKLFLLILPKKSGIKFSLK